MIRANLRSKFLIVLLVVSFLWSWQSNVYALVETHTDVALTKEAEEAARLLGIEDQVHKFIELREKGLLRTHALQTLRLQTSITRKIITTGLELRVISAKLDREIVFEEHARDKLIRERDFIVAATNNANFLQLSILAMIIDGPLEETHNSRTVLYGNRLNIVSGLTVGGLAGLSLLEQKGGWRHDRAQPNMLGPIFGLNSPDEEKLPPMLWTYLNSTVCEGENKMTRREQLLEYWKKTKVLSVNMNKQSNIEKVSAFGPHHNRWSETIKLISTRVTMLYDLRAMVDRLNGGLVQLLQGLDEKTYVY